MVKLRLVDREAAKLKIQKIFNNYLIKSIISKTYQINNDDSCYNCKELSINVVKLNFHHFIVKY